MTTKRLGGLFITISLAICLFSLAIFFPISGTIDTISAEQQFDYLPIGYENTAKYTYDDNGEKGNRTIYWAKGIDAPKMDSATSSNLGSGDYFHRNVTYATKNENGKPVADKSKIEYINYEYPITMGKGYYDLNKVETSNYCYLASSANIIHWWLDQNSAYIDEYVTRVLAKSIYAPTKGLRNIENITKDAWNKLRTITPIEVDVNSGNSMQILLNDYLVQNYLTHFVNRQDGYWPDRLWDYFFNGYLYDINDTGDPNTEDNYKMDPLGGIFYPIFDKQKLTSRVNGIKYETYKREFAKALASGKGVNLEISTVNPKLAHAITLWGAEYDDNGELTAIYVTDSDDYGEVDYNSNIAYGMRRYNVNKIGEELHITNYVGDNQEFIGPRVQMMLTLDLATDRWEEALSDTNAPSVEITDDLKDANYGIGAQMSDLAIGLADVKRGYYEYQWYESDSIDGNGVALNGKTSNRLWLPSALSSTAQTKYYYVKIKYYKNGKIAEKYSRRAKIDINDKYVNAQLPIGVSSGYKIHNVTLNQYLAPFKVEGATSSDNGVISYQWYMKTYGSNVDATSGATPIIGATTNTYQPSTSTEQHSVHYFCRVYNTVSSVTGQKTSYKDSTIHTVRITPPENAKLPMITNDLKGASYGYNASATALEILAKSNDGGVLSYQWYRATNESETGVKVGTNSATYTPDTTLSGTYYYYVVVTNYNKDAYKEQYATNVSNRVAITVANNDSTKSSDNYLTNIVVSDYTLSPNFNKNTLEYSIAVPNSVTSVTINVTKSHDKATYVINNASNLSVGANDVTIVVTAEDGSTRTYTIEVTRESTPTPPPVVESSDNYLTNIVVSDYTLSPNFNKNTLEYSIAVPNSVTSVTINVTKSHDKATYVINNASNLSVGANDVTIVVTAEDGSTRTYTIEVTREAETTDPDTDNPSPETPEPETPAPDTKPDGETTQPDTPITPDTPNNDANNDNNGGSGDSVDNNVDNGATDNGNTNKDDEGMTTDTKVIIGVSTALGVVILVIIVLCFFFRHRR